MVSRSNLESLLVKVGIEDSMPAFRWEALAPQGSG